MSTFYTKALNTLKELMLSMGLQYQYSKIEETYNDKSVEDTLKVMIRNETMFSARTQLFEIFRL